MTTPDLPERLRDVDRFVRSRIPNATITLHCLEAADLIDELTEALREANDHLKAVVGGPTPYDALLAKIGGNNGGRGLSQKCTQNRDRPRTFQQDPRIHALDGECVCGAKSCPQCGNGK